MRARCAVCSAVFAVSRDMQDAGGTAPERSGRRRRSRRRLPCPRSPPRLRPPRARRRILCRPQPVAPPPAAAAPLRSAAATGAALDAASAGLASRRGSSCSPAGEARGPGRFRADATSPGGPGPGVQPAGVQRGAGPRVLTAAGEPARRPRRRGPGGRPANPFLSQDPSLKAKRLARALVSDIVVYHPAKRQEGIRDGTLKELFEEEIKKSWEEYTEQVGREVAESTGFFREALNEILAGGRQIF